MLLRETFISKDNRIFSLVFNIFEFQKHITWLRNVLNYRASLSRTFVWNTWQLEKKPRRYSNRIHLIVISLKKRFYSYLTANIVSYLFCLFMSGLTRLNWLCYICFWTYWSKISLKWFTLLLLFFNGLIHIQYDYVYLMC